MRYKNIYLENDKKLYKKETFEDKSAAIIIDKDNALANVAKIFSHPNKSWFAVSKKNKQMVNTFSIPIKGLKMKVMLIHYQCRNIYLESKYPYWRSRWNLIWPKPNRCDFSGKSKSKYLCQCTNGLCEH